MKKNLVIILLFISTFSKAEGKKTELTLGIHPLHNPQKVIALFSPFVDYINKNAKLFSVKLVSSKDYADYNSKIKERTFDIINPNPYQTVKALKYRYKIINKWGNDELFKGVFLVRKDSGINKIEDLKNKSIAFPAPTALAATLMPKYLLYQNNLFPEKDYKQIFVGNQESAIMSAFNKTTDVGVSWIPPWNLMQKEHPEITNNLKIIKLTDSLPSNGILIKYEINKNIAAEINKLIINLEKTAEGKNLLKNIGIEYFENADEKTYLPVKKFIQDYEKRLGEIPW